MKKLSHLTRTSILLFCLFGLDKVLAFFRSIIVTRQFQLSPSSTLSTPPTTCRTCSTP